MMLNRFEYIKPNTVDEVLFHLARIGKEAKILAGGTDLLVQIKKRRVSPRYLIDLMGISELGQIEEENGEVRIGPGVSLASLEKSALIKKRFESLWKAVQVIGSPQIRNMGTVGGNLCVDTRCKYMDFSHPWGQEIPGKCFKRGGNVCHVVKGGDRCYATMGSDLATIMIAFHSKVVMKGESEKLISLEDFYTGEGKRVTRINPKELVTQIRVPFLPPHSGTSFLKYRWRESLDFPIVSAAAWVLKDPTQGTYQEIRLVLGALASAPIRLKKVEDLLRNQVLSHRTVEEAVQEGMRGIPIVSCSGIPVSYIRKVAQTFSVKAIKEAYEASH
jgi:4-hydroxybenzoyl-CoA reductase subunit beta